MMESTLAQLINHIVQLEIENMQLKEDKEELLKVLNTPESVEGSAAG